MLPATLRAALNAVVRAGLISVYPGRWTKLSKAPRPQPQVWTPALTERWGLDRRPDRPLSSCARCAGTD